MRASRRTVSERVRTCVAKRGDDINVAFFITTKKTKGAVGEGEGGVVRYGVIFIPRDAVDNDNFWGGKKKKKACQRSKKIDNVNTFLEEENTLARGGKAFSLLNQRKAENRYVVVSNK